MDNVTAWRGGGRMRAVDAMGLGVAAERRTAYVFREGAQAAVPVWETEGLLMCKTKRKNGERDDASRDGGRDA